VILQPARLEPIFLNRIWGAHRLDPLFPEKKELREPVGEAWLTGHDCRFAEGPFAGQKLGEAWPLMPPEWAGQKVGKDGPFPLLVKFIFPEEKLSVQVHPTDEYARQHEAPAGGLGKTEMWYVVSARPGAEVWVGLKPGTQAEGLRRAIVDGTVENCVAKVSVHAGDAIFVPAGTVHTIGPGMILCEIQEHSDLTYRVFDYNRRTAEGKPRELHVEKAMAVVNFGEQRGGKVEPLRLERGPLKETHFVACRYFAAEKWEFSERIAAATSPEHFDLLVFLEGSGRFEFSGGEAECAPAQVWLVPAGLGAYQIAPRSPTALLRTYVPSNLDDLVQRLSDRGVAGTAWSRLVYP
jgi:mannose-6-phosphate isomerase